MKPLIRYLLFGGVFIIAVNVFRVVVLDDDLSQVPPPWTLKDVLLLTVTLLVLAIPLPKLLRAMRSKRHQR